jgi:hypothetical protein
VFKHWADLFLDQDGVPDQRTISPEALKSALPHVWLCDYDHQADRFQYRLAGEHVTTSLDTGMRGRFLDVLTKASIYPRVYAYFGKCVEMPAALHISDWLYAEQSKIALGERVMLPYGDGTGDVTGILGATIRQWGNQITDDETDPSSHSRRYVYYRLSDGMPEIEDVNFS